MKDMAEGIAFAHRYGVKVYVTANILAHNRDLEGVREYFEELKEIKPDALIISDPGVFMIAKEVCPEIERHISTQANNTNYGTYLFWAWTGGKAGGVCKGAVPGGDPGNPGPHTPGYADRELYPRRHVHILFRQMLLSNYFVGRDANQAPAPIPAAGNIPLWRRPDPVNICLYMRMSVAPIYSTPRTCAWWSIFRR